jgi:hypothetical protein
MFIKNSEILDSPKYTCGAKLGKYLIYKYHIPVLNITKDNKYVFVDTKMLQTILKSLPIGIRLFYK